MGDQAEEKKIAKHICAGLLAHVDAGKTTLSEALLYTCGALRRLGRVDHRDAFLDTDALERERGITIFSKQAILQLDSCEITLLDTPGHVDFSAEMERTLQVLDYAVLLISGSDGVQGHTRTLWQLLRRYQIPTFLFVNKMDLDGANRETLMAQLQTELSEGCVDFGLQPAAVQEHLAMCGEDAMEEYLQNERLRDETVAGLLRRRQVYPCYFGSALKLDGVRELLEGISRYGQPPEYRPEFAARVFKIARDPQGTRLTFLKVTGGSLRVKDLLKGEGWEEKADQLRVYSGEKFTLMQEAPAGTVCAVTGLSQTMPGDGLGTESAQDKPMLQPVLEYQVRLPEGCDVPDAVRRLRQLEEEDPQLHLVWNPQTRELRVGLMGEVQLEILQRLILKRFDLAVEFDEGSIVYKETIAAPMEGVGHYEPLRHYAEVHLLLEPAEPGSGLHFDTLCSEDVLGRNWQRLIFTHLMEKSHRGVLTGAPITDMRITILAGRAHPKHTEGGDFRQATYRAVRQGLKKAESVLLEPWYAFRLELPNDAVGRAMTDLQHMGGSFQPPETGAEHAVLTGKAPVAALRGYQREVTAYTKGRGRLSCRVDGYRPCHNAPEVVAAVGYDSERDLENHTGSVFCAHGAGFEVKWQDVDGYAHLPLLETRTESETPQSTRIVKSVATGASPELDKELQAIFERTYGAIRRRDFLPQMVLRSDDKKELIAAMEPTAEFLLVDGYNILHAWDGLRDVARDNLDAARHLLMNILCNYQGYMKCNLILVFDAYKVPQGLGLAEKYHNIYIVYTKQAETADQYIERVTYELNGRRRVRVATSDGLEQLIILGHGATRVSATQFYDEVQRVNEEISRILRQNNQKNAL